MNNKLFKTLLWACAAVTLTAACSKDDDGGQADDANTPKLRALTLTEASITRATLTPGTDGKGLNPSWTAGDEITVWNMTVYDEPVNGANNRAANLTATTSAVTTSFSGGKVNCMNTDNLAVVYPATNFKNDGTYSISLTGQDGTLETLANKFHYLYGVATVTNDDATTATATMYKPMQPLLCICHFTFKQGETPVKANSFSIEISNLSSGSVLGNPGTYPQSATVTPVADPSKAKATPVTSSSPLTINIPSGGLDDVYVAMLPTDAACSYVFKVDDKSYEANAKFAAGRIVHAELVVQ